jgi:hypothetical protein
MSTGSPRNTSSNAAPTMTWLVPACSCDGCVAIAIFLHRAAAALARVAESDDDAPVAKDGAHVR